MALISQLQKRSHHIHSLRLITKIRTVTRSHTIPIGITWQEWVSCTSWRGIWVLRIARWRRKRLQSLMDCSNFLPIPVITNQQSFIRKVVQFARSPTSDSGLSPSETKFYQILPPSKFYQLLLEVKVFALILSYCLLEAVQCKEKCSLALRSNNWLFAE